MRSTALGSLVAMRCAGGAALRVETEISDAEGRYRGLLVYVPDPPASRNVRRAPIGGAAQGVSAARLW